MINDTFHAACVLSYSIQVRGADSSSEGYSYSGSPDIPCFI
jgi:hypothetical protein